MATNTATETCKEHTKKAHLLIYQPQEPQSLQNPTNRNNTMLIITANVLTHHRMTFLSIMAYICEYNVGSYIKIF